MGFRTLEITTSEGQAFVPIEDLNQIMVRGANVRLSTMDLSILSKNKVSVQTSASSRRQISGTSFIGRLSKVRPYYSKNRFEYRTLTSLGSC